MGCIWSVCVLVYEGGREKRWRSLFLVIPSEPAKWHSYTCMDIIVWYSIYIPFKKRTISAIYIIKDVNCWLIYTDFAYILHTSYFKPEQSKYIWGQKNLSNYSINILVFICILSTSWCPSHDIYIFAIIWVTMSNKHLPRNRRINSSENIHNQTRKVLSLKRMF